MKRLPESPMKILAGEKLKTRKPRAAPIKTTRIRTAAALPASL